MEIGIGFPYMENKIFIYKVLVLSVTSVTVGIFGEFELAIRIVNCNSPGAPPHTCIPIPIQGFPGSGAGGLCSVGREREEEKKKTQTLAGLRLHLSSRQSCMNNRPCRFGFSLPYRHRTVRFLEPFVLRLLARQPARVVSRKRKPRIAGLGHQPFTR